MKVDREQLAWAAGFFDGEGGTWCYPSSRKIMAAAPQTHPAPIYRLQLVLGGLGRIHEIEPKPHWQRSKSKRWVWQAQSFEEVQAVVALLWRFLCKPKREQAAIALRRYLQEVALAG